jgi:O-antigen ligase
MHDVRGLAWLVVALAAGVAIGWLPQTQAALAVAGAIFFVTALLWPHLALYALVFSVPYETLRQVELGGFAISSTEVLVALLLIAWLVRVAARLERPRPVPLLIPVLILLWTYGLSLLQATDTTLALKETAKWVEVAAVMLVAAHTLTDRRRVAFLLLCMFAAGWAQSGLGAYQFFYQVGPESFVFGSYLRAHGTFGQPNALGGYLGLILPLAVSAALLLGPLLVAWWRRHDRVPSPASGGPSTRSAHCVWPVRSHRGTRRSLHRWGDALTSAWTVALAGTVSVAVLGAGLVMSYSRGAWLAFVMAAVMVWSLRSRRAFAVLVALALVAVIALPLGVMDLMPSFITARLGSITESMALFDARTVLVTDENFATVQRMAFWQTALAMWEEHPWVGVGPGNYPVAYAKYYVHPAFPEPLAGHPHNVYLQFLAEVGIVGLAAYLLLLAWALAAALRALRHLPSHVHFWRAVTIGVIGVFVAVVVHTLFDNLYVHGMNVYVGLALGLVAAVPAADLSR